MVTICEWITNPPHLATSGIIETLTLLKKITADTGHY